MRRQCRLLPLRGLAPGLLAALVLVSASGLAPTPLEAVESITRVTPSLTLATVRLGRDGTEVTFVGQEFAASDVARIGGQPLLGARFVDATRITGRVPVLAPGIYDADLVNARGLVVATLRNAVEVTDPVTVTSVTPSAVSRAGGTAVVVHGTNFRNATQIRFGTHLLGSPVAAADHLSISGVAPALDAGEADGPYDVTARDSRGTATLPNGVVYSTPFELTSVDPTRVVTTGGTEVTFHGTGFQAGSTLRIGGQPCASIQFIDATRMSGRSPALAAGFHDAEIRLPAAGAVISRTLPRAVEAIAPAAIRTVAPPEVSTLGGTPVTITGARFLPETVFRLGTLELQGAAVAADGNSVTGTAPAQAAGPKDVTATDFRGTVTLPGGVTYVGPARPDVLPPRVTDSALAYGQARFEWENLEDYDQIEVLDANERVLARLPGTARSYQMSSGGARQVSLKFRGVKNGSFSAAKDFLAKVFQCEIPPPLIGLAAPGELEFPLYGGHASVVSDPCADPGQGGGAATLEIAHPQNGFAHVQSVGGTGYAISPSAIEDIDSSIFKLLDRNKLTTGFTLETDADKLEVGVYLRKIAVAAGLELRGRLIHVFPEDGLSMEFSFPEMLIKPQKEWLRTVVFRSYVDGQGATRPCVDGLGNLKKLPAGEYLLDLYCSGGDPKLPYFLVADDPLDVELLIKGSPCPPYPMVQVTDLTGFRSVPIIECIDHQIITAPGNLFQLMVSFHSQGTWVDFDNKVYRIHPDTQLCPPNGPPVTDPLKTIPDWEFTWAIYQKEEVPVCHSSGASPILEYVTLPDWGCYKIELTVRDKRCGLESKYSQEVAIFPLSISCEASHVAPSTLCTPSGHQMSSAYFFPTPDPKNVYGVVGLDPPPGVGSFQGERPVEVRILVVPCYCGTSNAQIESCPSPSINNPADPSDDDIEFRLAVKSGFNYTPFVGAQLIVDDPCSQVVNGPKYLILRIDDIGKLPHQPSLGQMQFKSVYIQARNRYIVAADGFTRIPGDSSTCWRNIASPLRLSNRPDSLPTSIWSGNFEPGDASYHFVAKSSPGTEQKFALGPSPPIPLDIPDVDTEVPGSSKNDVSTGFTSRFMAIKGQWAPEDATGGMSGDTLNNDLKGEPLQVAPKVKGGGGGGALGAGGLDFPSYEWCTKETIFKQKFSSKLFEAIIYTGTIGPVPVTIWGSIGLGIDFLIEAYANVEVAPFAPLEGGNFVETYFDLKSQVGISIPCEVRADILGGLASIAMRLTPEALFTLIPYFDLKFPQYAQPIIDYFLEAVFSLYFEVEVCIQTIILGEQCFGTGKIAIIDHANLIPPHGSEPARPGDCAGQGGAAGLEEAAEELPPGTIAAPGGAGGGSFSYSAYKVAVAPVTITSPDRETVVDVWMEELGDQLLQIRVNGTVVKGSGFPGLGYYIIDPAAAFVSNNAVIFAWTAPALDLHPEDTPPIGDPAYLPTVNSNLSTAEVHISALIRDPINPQTSDWRLFDISTYRTHLMDPFPLSPDWRADGRASVGADLSSGEALVACVRYDTPDVLIQDGVTTATVACADGEVCLCTNPVRPCRLKRVTVPKIRYQMESTAIYVRRVGIRIETPPNSFLGFSELRSEPFKVSPPGINIQPSISGSPTGQHAWVVWVHDSTPGHENLVDSNVGRQILYSVYTKNPADLDDPGQWSAPLGALAMPDDYPALLEPRVYLKSEDDGLLVFTAVKGGAPLRDTGFGGNRLLYGARLTDGAFGEPFVVHGKCRKRQYGYEQSISFDIPDLIDPLSKLKWKNPEWVMTFQELGVLGTRESSGNVMVTFLGAGQNTWSPPVNLTPDGNIHSNLAATVGKNGLHTVHFDGGPAAFEAGVGGGAALGGGGALGDSKTCVINDFALEPDPAVTGCRLDFPYASPGSIVRATIQLENRGLASTPVSSVSEESALEVRILLIDAEGRETVAARGPAPELAPGETAQVALEIEAPLDPARLLAEVLPGPLDRDFSNNRVECFFGAPPPDHLTCETIVTEVFDDDGNAGESLAAKLSWSSPAVYDELIIYRDGAMVGALPGGCQMWIDDSVTAGVHTWEIRGRIRVSKSMRATCSLELAPPSGETFRRGDGDSNGRVELTDAVVVLGYLFLGGREPPCQDAADADDNGRLEITDAVRDLNYLFSGGVPPPAPGPLDCGRDPTEDRLPPCGGECR